MGHFSQTLTVIVPVIVVIISGFLSKKNNLIKPEGVDGMRTFITSIALPAAMFRAIATMKMTKEVWICCIVIFLTVLIVFLIGRLLLIVFPKLNPMMPFLITCFEAGMLGYPLYTLLFGMDMLSNAIIIALGSDLFVFTIYSALLRQQEGQGGIKDTINSMLKSPIFISIVLGIIFSATNFNSKFGDSTILTVFFSVLDFFGKPIACVMLFVIGCGISFSKKNILEVFLTCFIRLILMGIFAFIVIYTLNIFIELNEYLKTAVFLLFFLPAPYILPVFAKKEENRVFLSTVLSINLIFSMISFSIITYLVAN